MIFGSIFQSYYFSESTIDEFKVILKNIFEHSKVNWNIAVKKFPLKISYRNSKEVEKVLEVKYIPIWESQKLVKIMITILDITSKEQFSKNKKRYNLTQVAELTGIKKNTLKTWIHRYSLSSSLKDDKGNFLYSEEELQRFKAYGDLQKTGSKIGNLIKLSDKELKELGRRLKVEDDNDHLKMKTSVVDILNNLFFFVKGKQFSIFFYEIRKLKYF